MTSTSTDLLSVWLRVQNHTLVRYCCFFMEVRLGLGSRAQSLEL